MAASSANTASEAARRYAGALFDLARDKGKLPVVAKDLVALADTISGNDELKGVLTNAAVSRDAKTKALVAIAEKSGLSKSTVGFVGTMAQNGRSGDLMGAMAHFDKLYADHRGVKRALARTATEMTAAQRKKLETLLAKSVGGDVELATEVDPALVGGLQLRIGSTLIDASLATKLDRMNIAMKGA